MTDRVKKKPYNPYFEAISSEEAYKKAEREGKKVVLPDEYTLQIDIDTKEAYELMVNRLVDLTMWDYWPIIEKDEVSFTGEPHRHVYIRVAKKLEILERIALQMYLGSDSKRELLSIIRYTMNDPAPTKFFERKDDE